MAVAVLSLIELLMNDDIGVIKWDPVEFIMVTFKVNKVEAEVILAAFEIALCVIGGAIAGRYGTEEIAVACCADMVAEEAELAVESSAPIIERQAAESALAAGYEAGTVEYGAAKQEAIMALEDMVRQTSKNSSKIAIQQYVRQDVASMATGNLSELIKKASQESTKRVLAQEGRITAEQAARGTVNNAAQKAAAQEARREIALQTVADIARVDEKILAAETADRLTVEGMKNEGWKALVRGTTSAFFTTAHNNVYADSVDLATRGHSKKCQLAWKITMTVIQGIIQGIALSYSSSTFAASENTAHKMLAVAGAAGQTLAMGAESAEHFFQAIVAKLNAIGIEWNAMLKIESEYLRQILGANQENTDEERKSSQEEITEDVKFTHDLTEHLWESIQVGNRVLAAAAV